MLNKWYDEENEFEVAVTGFLPGDQTECFCHSVWQRKLLYRQTL